MKDQVNRLSHDYALALGRSGAEFIILDMKAK
jgi:hypothetical protein